MASRRPICPLERMRGARAAFGWYFALRLALRVWVSAFLPQSRIIQGLRECEGKFEAKWIARFFFCFQFVIRFDLLVL